MPEEFSAIPLTDVLRAANELVSAGLIKDYALGGALAAIYLHRTDYHVRCGHHFRRERQNIERRNSRDLLASPIERLAGRTRAFVNWRFPSAISRCIGIN